MGAEKIEPKRVRDDLFAGLPSLLTTEHAGDRSQKPFCS
jgi:hypothetical protein